MKTALVVLSLVLLCSSVPASAQNYVAPDILKQWVDSGRPVIMIDLQPADAFAQRHIRGAIMTDAYDVQTAEQEERLNIALPEIKGSDHAVVIIHAPGKMGRIGAGNAYDYFLSRGVSERRLFILDGGIDNWSYEHLIEKSKK